MKLRSSHLLITLLGGLVASQLGTVDRWLDVRTPLLTLLSVIAGAVLLRLSRGLPLTDTEAFNLTDARKIAHAMKLSVRALRALMVVIFFAAFALIFVGDISTGASLLMEAQLSASSKTRLEGLIDGSLSGILGALVSYVVVRVYSVVQGDIGLVDLQASAFLRKIMKRQGDAFDEKRRPLPKDKFPSEERYGSRITSE